MTAPPHVLKARSRFVGTRIVAGEGVPNIGLAPARIALDPGAALLHINGTHSEGVDSNGQINLHTDSEERLEVVTHVLAKTAVLAYHGKCAPSVEWR